MPKRSNLEYVAIGAAVYAGGLILYNMQQNKQGGIGISNTHERIPQKVEPPPVIRNPQQGNGYFGYFNEWFYGGRPNTHVNEL